MYHSDTRVKIVTNESTILILIVRNLSQNIYNQTIIIPMKDDKKEEFLDLHKTYGDFIFENAGMGMQMNDGMYYHYSKVCELLKKYTHEKERKHVQLATDYKNQEEQNDSFRSKISHLEELLKAADEICNMHDNSGYFTTVGEYYTALNKSVRDYQTLKNKQ